MALQYDQILAGNCFGQINVAPVPCSNSTIEVEKNEENNLLDQLGCSIEDLFDTARQFFKGIGQKIFIGFMTMFFF